MDTNLFIDHQNMIERRKTVTLENLSLLFSSVLHILFASHFTLLKFVFCVHEVTLESVHYLRISLFIFVSTFCYFSISSSFVSIAY